MNDKVNQLKSIGYTNKQILLILSICEIENFEFKYGSIIYTILDEMTIKHIKSVQQKVETLLNQSEMSFSTHFSLNQLVFDIEC